MDVAASRSQQGFVRVPKTETFQNTTDKSLTINQHKQNDTDSQQDCNSNLDVLHRIKQRKGKGRSMKPHVFCLSIILGPLLFSDAHVCAQWRYRFRVRDNMHQDPVHLQGHQLSRGGPVHPARVPRGLDAVVTGHEVQARPSATPN